MAEKNMAVWSSSVLRPIVLYHVNNGLSNFIRILRKALSPRSRGKLFSTNFSINLGLFCASEKIPEKNFKKGLDSEAPTRYTDGIR